MPCFLPCESIKLLLKLFTGKGLPFQTCSNRKDCGVCVWKMEENEPVWQAHVGCWGVKSLFLGRLLVKGRFPERCAVRLCQLVVWSWGQCPTCTASFIFNTFWGTLSPWVYLFFEVGSVPYNKHENKWPCVAEHAALCERLQQEVRTWNGADMQCGFGNAREVFRRSLEDAQWPCFYFLASEVEDLKNQLAEYIIYCLSQI